MNECRKDVLGRLSEKKCAVPLATHPFFCNLLLLQNLRTISPTPLATVFRSLEERKIKHK
jgi:hypothetical protein